MIDDYDLVVASFQSQYGLRLSREIHTMPWQEFKSYMVGVSSETPLGRIIAIRSEKDKEVLKHFTPEQKRIRNEWILRKGKVKVSKEEMSRVLEGIKQAFISLAGGGK